MNRKYLNLMKRTLLLLFASSLAFIACDAKTAGDDGGNQDNKDEFVADVAAPDIFVKGQQGYHTYRIPALAKTVKGTILAFCEGRKESGSDTGDINLILRRSIDDGKTWSPIITVWDDGYNTCGNPSPVVDPVTGRIHLLMTWNLGTDGKSAGDFNNGKTKDTRRVFYTYSDDDGVTWKEPEEITSQAKGEGYGWYATGPCHAIILTKGKYAGRIVVPCDCNKIGGAGFSHVIYSDDNGENWKIGGMISGGNESTVAELEDGRILISCRCSGGKRMLAWSEDGGETFGESVKMASLPDPKCQASLLNTVYEGQYVLLHSNCADASSRIKMTVKASTDGGGTWNAGHIVWDGMTAYSDIVMINENIIGILYENGSSSSYERISFDRVAMSYVLDSDKD